MSKRIVTDHQLLQITLDRLCQQLIENHGDFSESLILGLQPRGVFLAERIKAKLKARLKKEVQLGYIDATFFRDDFRRSETPLKANATKVPFPIVDKKVILVDDVLYTGRTVRAALDAMIALGRPSKVELLVLVNRSYSRDLPIQPNYVGREVNCLPSEHVVVELQAESEGKDSISLVIKK